MSNHILIVDDSSRVRSLTRVYLESHADCIVCGEASDGLEAIEKAQALSPDLIVMDLSMPRMNGLEAAQILKIRAPHIPIVLFTMHETAVRHDSLLAGIRAVVPKDNLEVLLAQVKTLLRATG